MKLNFSIKELCQSKTAQKNNIGNIPQTIEIQDNMLELIFYFLQPLREKINKPMIISSGYRCSKLNTLVGGSKTSHHLQGKAADFVVANMSISDTINFIMKSDLKWTQLIEEYSNKKTWVHISYDKNDLKCEVLRYKNGKYYKL